MFYIQQTNENGCGFACLKILLANIRHDKRYLFLPEKEEGKSYSYKELIELGNQNGCHLRGFRVDHKEEIVKHKVLPIIVSLTLKEGSYHAVLVHKINKKRVYILDPDSGSYSLPIGKFLALWDGTCLSIESDDGAGFTYDVSDPKKKSSYVLTAIAQIISGIFCILGVYFINKKVDIVIPIFFFSLFIITELLLKTILFRTMNDTDSHFLKDLSIKKEQFQTFFERLENYKKLSLVNPISFGTTLVVSIFIIFIVVMNNIWNVLLVLTPICLSLLDVFFIAPSRNKKERIVAIKERELVNSEDVNEYISKMNSIHKNSYKIAKDELGKRYIYIFIMMVMSLLVVAINNEFILSQVMFFLFVQIMLNEYLVKLFSFSNKMHEFDLAKAKLMNTIHQDDENN